MPVMNSDKTVIVIAGPTAVGKTEAAIKVAEKYNCPIISGDSRQCYKELNIGVARPSLKELETATHYFIATHSITENFSAADFEKYAIEISEQLFKKHDKIILTGGTGLYLKAFCEGLDEIPPIDAEIREHINFSFQQFGIERLLQELKNEDPEFYEKGEVQNPRRIMRALEVFRQTGKSILQFQRKEKKERNFNIIKFGLELPREKLYENINSRVDKMIAEGLEEEVRSLMKFKNLNALQTVGYRELFGYLEGKYTREKAIELIKQNTRHYAKRQMTWFKKDISFNWIKADKSSAEKIIEIVNNHSG